MKKQWKLTMVQWIPVYSSTLRKCDYTSRRSDNDIPRSNFHRKCRACRCFHISRLDSLFYSDTFHRRDHRMLRLYSRTSSCTSFRNDLVDRLKWKLLEKLTNFESFQLTYITNGSTVARFTFALIRCSAISVHASFLTVWNTFILGWVFNKSFTAFPNRSRLLQNFGFFNLPHFDFRFSASEWRLCAPNVLRFLIRH